ncbi:MAG: hypothetical protein LC652_10980 [Halomonas sp.]|nr:hypothetical protein [Halomonas sp.]
MNHIDITSAVTTLDLHIMWLEGLAESMARQGMPPGDVEQARHHARGLDKLSKTLIDFMPDDTIHRIERPYASGVLEVYREPQRGWYEWRIVDNGQTLHDSGTLSNDDGTVGAMYGSPGIALRDALNHDEPPRKPPLVKRIEWLPTCDALSDNLAQVDLLADTVKGLAAELAKASVNAKAQRSSRNPDHAAGRLAMIYLDERTRTTDELADEMNATAARLSEMAHRLSPDSGD